MPPVTNSTFKFRTLTPNSMYLTTANDPANLETLLPRFLAELGVKTGGVALGVTEPPPDFFLPPVNKSSVKINFHISDFDTYPS